MKGTTASALFFSLLLSAVAANAEILSPVEVCAKASGDIAIAARTPQVDLYSDSTGAQKVITLDHDKFPACAPITGRSPNMMLQVTVNGVKYWVPPHMVKYRFAGNLPAVCRNLAMDSNQQKVVSTRGLGEDCLNGGGPK